MNKASNKEWAHPHDPEAQMGDVSGGRELGPPGSAPSATQLNGGHQQNRFYDLF